MPQEIATTRQRINTVRALIVRHCRHRGWCLVLAAALLSGCGTLGYYYQSVHGQLSLMSRARDIDAVLKDPDVPASVRAKLRLVKRIRRFASARLHLPDNDSYRSYANLGREFAVWNVYAALPLSVEPHEWCFPIVGCVIYRGYFKESAARRYAATLRREGLETDVAGVPAYSTLGWFDDPVLSTVLGYPDADLAGLIFHELAHQVAYAKGDSVFNESFATTVEIEGVERWLRYQGRAGQVVAYRKRRKRDRQVVEIILAYRAGLREVYRSAHSEEWKLTRKADIIASLKRAYANLRRQWDGYLGYRRWFEQDLNNAHFAAVAAYYRLVPAFRALLAHHAGDLPDFYSAVAELARLPPEVRVVRLRQLGDAPGVGANSQLESRS